MTSELADKLADLFNSLPVNDDGAVPWSLMANAIDEARRLAIESTETAALRRSGGLKPVERIEMVNYETGFQTPADPMWRVEVSGYCADFETETAANNFHAAIAALHPSDSPALEAGVAELRAELAREKARADRLDALINSPETEDWIAGVPLEAAHQVERWGASHDAGKTAWDWFWLIGYLSQKAAASQIAGDVFKAKHHTISTAAALLNWHRSISGENTEMRPGIDPVARGVEAALSIPATESGK
jgi:hypothetical protein